MIRKNDFCLVQLISFPLLYYVHKSLSFDLEALGGKEGRKDIKGEKAAFPLLKEEVPLGPKEPWSSNDSFIFFLLK